MPGVFDLNPLRAIPQNGDGIAFGVGDGVAIPAYTPGILTLVSDGTNSRYLKGDTSGRLVVVGASAIGAAPVGDPISVAGIDGGGLKRDLLIKNAAPLASDYGLVVRVIGAGGTGADVNVAGWFGSTAPTVGQKAMANSIPVVIPSDQTLNVSIAPPTAGTNWVIWGDFLPGGTTPVALERTTYTEQYANFQGSIASNNAADTAAGAGARTVKITYFDATGVGPYTETVALNGVTPVNLVNLDHCYIEKLEVMTTGTRYGSNAGVITLYSGLAGAGTVVGTIAATNNLTFWAHHYVAVGKTAYVKDVTLGTQANRGGSFWVTRGNPLVTTDPEVQITPTFRTAQNTPLSIYPFTIPIAVATGFVRLRMYVQADGVATPNSYFGSFTVNEV